MKNNNNNHEEKSIPRPFRELIERMTPQQQEEIRKKTRRLLERYRNRSSGT